MGIYWQAKQKIRLSGTLLHGIINIWTNGIWYGSLPRPRRVRQENTSEKENKEMKMGGPPASVIRAVLKVITVVKKH
jgi:hypothetical protein